MKIFENRLQAGRLLAEKLLSLKSGMQNPIVLGIPRGGVPVGYAVAKALECPLDTIVLRKLPIPDNPEAGFGAVTLDKTVTFNEVLLSQIYLSETQTAGIINKVYKEVERRNKAYRKNKPFPSLEGRSVILTDDGLASGYTMLAAVKFVKNKQAKDTIVASPVAHRQAYEMIKKESHKIVVLHISDEPYFAVASFYEEFPDMSDKEVMGFLKGEANET